MEKRCILMKAFGWTPDHIRKRIPGVQGWAYYNWARENEASVWGSNLERKSPGYVKQEYDRILNHG